MFSGMLRVKETFILRNKKFFFSFHCIKCYNLKILSAASFFFFWWYVTLLAPHLLSFDQNKILLLYHLIIYIRHLPIDIKLHNGIPLKYKNLIFSLKL